MIEIRLFATFRINREKIYLLNAENYSTVDEVLRQLDIPTSEVAICLINGFHQPTHTPIQRGDIISLFPPVGGG